MSHSELAIETEQAGVGIKESPRVSWFRSTFPGFFTEKVVKHREAGKGLPLPISQSKSRWQPVTWKLGGGRTTHIALHLRLDDRSFYFRSLTDDVELPVDRATLLTAVSVVQGSEWVRIHLGTEGFCLNRAELRAAFNMLLGT